MNPLIEKFFLETKSAFRFLETDYNYSITEKQENMEYFPDSIVSVNYTNPMIEVKVFWHFASATMSVAFTIRGGKQESIMSSIRIIPTINIYTLMQARCIEHDDVETIKKANGVTFSQIKRREKQINDDMKGEVEKRAFLVKRFAMDIISGDMSAFVASSQL